MKDATIIEAHTIFDKTCRYFVHIKVPESEIPIVMGASQLEARNDLVMRLDEKGVDKLKQALHLQEVEAERLRGILEKEDRL